MRVLLTGITVTLAVCIAQPASATPAFAVREGLPCRMCHVNPSGGGMRNRYGRYVFGPTQLVAGYPFPSRGTNALDVDVGDTLAFGADARLAGISQRPGDPDVPDVLTFFQMQADLYVAATPYDGLTLYYDQGSYGSFEAMVVYAFGLGSPALSGYVKVGRFAPSFGLRLVDHDVFTREELGFGPRDKDAGAEAGFYLGPVLLQFGVLNGVGADRKLDENTDKSAIARAEVQFEVGAFRFTLGGSGYINDVGTRTEVAMNVVDTRARLLSGGAHWGVGLGRFAYYGEIVGAKIKPSAENTEQLDNRSLRSFQALDVRLAKGLDLNFTHELREPDIDLQSGRANRIGAGVEFYPIPGVEIKTLYRHSFGFGPAEERNEGTDELIAMVHVFL